MEAALGGHEIFDFDFASMKENVVSAGVHDLSTLAEVLLRDTCVANYRRAYWKQGWMWEEN
jgi:hypothetical protein